MLTFALFATLALSGDDPSSFALLADRVISVAEDDRVFMPGMVLVRDDLIEYIGEPIEVPEGYASLEVEGWLAPGMIDLHSHVVTRGFGGINDMIYPVNTDLSTRGTIVPSNRAMRLACASGVTSLFLIPGSGTSVGGFGVLYKTNTDEHYERSVLADPGGMKVAQTHNPERRGGDLGVTRSGLFWNLARANRQAIAAIDAVEKGEPVDLHIRVLARIHSGELPVLIHCAGSDGVGATARMWRQEFPTRSVLSHGSFDGWQVAPFLAEVGMPVNHGPRTFDFVSARTGRIVGSAAVFDEAGVPDFSLNTDAPVIPAWEFSLQATVSARLGADAYRMLRALTLHPARSFGPALVRGEFAYHGCYWIGPVIGAIVGAVVYEKLMREPAKDAATQAKL